MKFTLKWKELRLGRWVQCRLDVPQIDAYVVEFIDSLMGRTDFQGVSITPFDEE